MNIVIIVCNCGSVFNDSHNNDSGECQNTNDTNSESVDQIVIIVSNITMIATLYRALMTIEWFHFCVNILSLMWFGHRVRYWQVYPII